MNTSRHFRARWGVLAAAVALTAAACSRAVRRPEVAPPVVAATDTVNRDSLRADSIRADSVAQARDVERARAIADSLRADSLRRAQDTARTPAGTPRRRATRDCVLDLTGSPETSRATLQSFPDSSHNTYVGGGFVGRCQGQNNSIKADSGEFYETAGIMNLYGNVVYIDSGKIQFTAMRANYFTREERLYAEGSVVATQLASGSTFSGQTMEYYRARPGIRDESRLFAPGRPTVRLAEIDTTGTPGTPVLITANMMEDRNDSLLFAWGAVNIDRGTITATSDSASYDKAGSQARLIRNATVNSTDPERPFKLTGDTIQMFNRDRALERVVAIHKATAVNVDLRLISEQLDLRLVDQQLERAYAYGAGRAQAKTPEQELEADSLAIFMQGKRVREVHAIGQAFALGIPDTTRIRSEDRDMLRGDSVFARFDTTTIPGDTSSQAKVREIESIGNASSLFQVASRRGPLCPASVNYARGRTILISFDSGTVRSVRVDSSASGVFLEPIPDSLGVNSAACGGAPADTTTPVQPPARTPPAAPVPSMARSQTPIERRRNTPKSAAPTLLLSPHVARPSSSPHD